MIDTDCTSQSMNLKLKAPFWSCALIVYTYMLFLFILHQFYIFLIVLYSKLFLSLQARSSQLFVLDQKFKLTFYIHCLDYAVPFIVFQKRRSQSRVILCTVWCQHNLKSLLRLQRVISASHQGSSTQSKNHFS